MKINVTKSYLPNKEKYYKNVDRIFENGWLTNNGPLVQELTQRLSEYLGVEHLLLVSNGTIALQILYKTLGLTGNVVTTPFSFVATTSSLAWEGLTPRFADIDDRSLTLDVEKTRASIDADTSAILGVHVYGNPCDVVGLEQLAQEKGIKLIFDAAHSFNVNYEGTSILNYGDASTLSFHSTKLFHTIEGGAIIFRNKADLERAKLIINFGIAGPEQVECIGINGKMNEFQAAMGLTVLDDIKGNMEKRQAIADYYDAHINPDYLKVDWRAGSNRNYAYYPIILDSEERLLQIVSKLAQHEVTPRRYFKPSLNTLSYLEYVPMPISEDITERVLCIPIYESLGTESADLIVKCINDA